MRRVEAIEARGTVRRGGAGGVAYLDFAHCGSAHFKWPAPNLKLDVSLVLVLNFFQRGLT